jgi:hypothetical protein
VTLRPRTLAQRGPGLTSVATRSGVANGASGTSKCCASSETVLSPLMAANATFALNAGVWFRRARLLIVSPDWLGTACPLSGRNSTYRPVQISEASSVDALEGRKIGFLFIDTDDAVGGDFSTYMAHLADNAILGIDDCLSDDKVAARKATFVKTWIDGMVANGLPFGAWRRPMRVPWRPARPTGAVAARRRASAVPIGSLSSR